VEEELESMSFAARIGRGGLWVLLAVVVAGLALLVTRIAARGRAAAEAMSAELLSPLDTAAMERAGAADPGAATAADAGPRTPVPPAADAARVDSRDSTTADSAAAAGPEPEPKPPPLDPELFPDWTTFAEAVPLARRGDRPVMLAFSAWGCDLCDQLARDVFRDEAAGVTLRSAVVPVAVADPLAGDSDPAREADGLQRRFGVTSFPTLVLYFPASGRVRKLEGYPGRDRTLRWVTETTASAR
jgi:hypothetical protein